MSSTSTQTWCRPERFSRNRAITESGSVGSSSSRCDSPTGRNAARTFSVGTSCVASTREARAPRKAARAPSAMLGTAIPGGRSSAISHIHVQRSLPGSRPLASRRCNGSQLAARRSRLRLVGGVNGSLSAARRRGSARATAAPGPLVAGVDPLGRVSSNAAAGGRAASARAGPRPRRGPRNASMAVEHARRCPCPSVATVFTISGAAASGAAIESIDWISVTTRSTPSRSALFTTKTSAISMMPALSACTSSPRPGTSTTRLTSAVPTISTSSWPTPTVSTSTTSLPDARQHGEHVGGGGGQAAQVAARGHRADEHARVDGVRLHPDAVAQDRPAA